MSGAVSKYTSRPFSSASAILSVWRRDLGLVGIGAWLGFLVLSMALVCPRVIAKEGSRPFFHTVMLVTSQALVSHLPQLYLELHN